MKTSLFSLFLLLSCLTAHTQSRDQQVASKRVALVIGNAEYQHSNRLNNPVNDAADMSAALQDLGFRVIKYTNATLPTMRAALNEFSKQLAGAEIAIFYYAGHGLEGEDDNSVKQNFLIPTDAMLAYEADIVSECITANSFLKRMDNAGVATKVVILDACRSNTYTRNWVANPNSQRDYVAGLAPMKGGAGTLIAFATEPGKTSADGTGRNGTYTEALLQHIKKTNTSLVDILIYVSGTVMSNTRNVQQPWVHNSLNAPFYLNPQQVNSNPAPVANPDPDNDGLIGAADRCPDVYGKVEDYGCPPSKATPPSKPAPTATFDIPVPNMIYVEGNGSVESFYIGETEITTGQYLAFCNATKSHYPEWLEAGNDYNVNTGKNTYYKNLGISESAVSLPITGVSWNDAVAYCEWLKEKTGQNYKLPTEAQWEYAAKGGSSASSLTAKYEYVGSNDINAVAWYSENAGGKPHNVKGKQKNELGLYDMTGNVWEWCENLYSSGGSDRVGRGGSWGSSAARCRVANRNFLSPVDRSSILGFRLSRTL